MKTVLKILAKLDNTAISVDLHKRFKIDLISVLNNIFAKIYNSLEQKKQWKRLLRDHRIDPILKEMLLVFEDSSILQTSKYWKALNYKNINQLINDGFKNFKQTVALNYFTWLPKGDDSQLLFLKSKLPSKRVYLAYKKAKKEKRHTLFSDQQSNQYNFLVLLLWEYLNKSGLKNIVHRLEEPPLGNAPSLKVGSRNVSQDLLNSVLEYNSILEGFRKIGKGDRILEIGAGYGRTAYVLLTLHPGLRYVVADIPPALYISQTYLQKVFPKKKIFNFRTFNDYANVKQEFEEADIAFLMPNQLQYLPNKSIDVFLAIDCLHEMLPKDILAYFDMVDRLSKGFYFKCWKKTIIPYDNIALKEEDYKLKETWKKIYWRTCKVQTQFFEAAIST